MDVKQNLRTILYNKIIIEHVMDQNEFAKALGESAQNANKWFNPNFPNAVPNVNHYTRICELLNVTIFDIFGIEKPKSNNIELTDDHIKIIENLKEHEDMVVHVKNLLGIKE